MSKESMQIRQEDVDVFSAALPDKAKKSLGNDVIKELCETLHDPEVYESYRENLIGFTHILQQGRFKLTSYINAVKFVSYRMMGKKQGEAYRLVFLDKIRQWDASGTPVKAQGKYISAYNKSKLVMLVYEAAYIPIHILNRNNYQKAINKQVELMLSAKSEMVQTTAANSLLNHLKAPEAAQLDINIKSDADGSIEALAESTQALVAQQKLMLRNGLMNVEQIAHQNIIVGTPVVSSDDDDEEAEFVEVADTPDVLESFTPGSTSDLF